MTDKIILLVDDERSILNLIKEMLKDQFEKILVAENGREALEIISTHPQIFCVICDIQMPEMGGIETIKHVRELGHDTPFIFFTGFGDSKIRREASKHGAIDLITKPNIAPLLDAVLSLRDKEDIQGAI